jgi:hypothetical protein
MVGDVPRSAIAELENWDWKGSLLPLVWVVSLRMKISVLTKLGNLPKTVDPYGSDSNFDNSLLTVLCLKDVN